MFANNFTHLECLFIVFIYGNLYRYRLSTSLWYIRVNSVHCARSRMRRQLCTLYIRTINGDDRALMVGYGYDKTEADRIFHRIGNVEIWCVDANEEKVYLFLKTCFSSIFLRMTYKIDGLIQFPILISNLFSRTI